MDLIRPITWNVNLLSEHSHAPSCKYCLCCFGAAMVELNLAEKAMAPHSSTLAWKIPWMEEPGRLQSMGSWRNGHDWATSLSRSRIGKGNGNPLQCSCLENPRDGGAWWAAIYAVAESDTAKRLSSSSSTKLNIFLILPHYRKRLPIPGLELSKCSSVL